jgi:hypothetical protein
VATTSPLSCLAPDRPVDAPVTSLAGRYGRMLPDLPPLECDDEALLALGLAAAIPDDDLVDGGEAAGWPVFGQLVAHDITADRSPLTARADAARITNVRTPRANLECLYGDGPVGAPFLYQRHDPAKLLSAGHDVPRNSEGTALLGDPRDDTHQLIAQLHAVLIRGHNLVVGGDRLGPVGGRIVAEVLIGIVRNDPESHLAVAPEWRPGLLRDDGVFGMAELLEGIGA